MDINFRVVSETDIEKIRVWRNSDLIKGVSYNREDIDKRRQSEWFHNIKENSSQVHWIVQVDSTDVGYAAIKNIDKANNRCEFSSLYIGEVDYINGGAGALIEYKIIDKIFKSYEWIDKIHCEVLEFNKEVVQLHKRFGFLEEGKLVDHYLLDGKYENVVLLALFRTEWIHVKEKLKRILIR